MCVKGTSDKQGQWRAAADAGMLEWSDDNLSYRISYSGLKLSCEDLLRMAGAATLVLVLHITIELCVRPQIPGHFTSTI